MMDVESQQVVAQTSVCELGTGSHRHRLKPVPLNLPGIRRRFERRALKGGN
jgi:hypothetical protein